MHVYYYYSGLLLLLIITDIRASSMHSKIQKCRRGYSTCKWDGLWTCCWSFHWRCWCSIGAGKNAGIRNDLVSTRRVFENTVLLYSSYYLQVCMYYIPSATIEEASWSTPPPPAFSCMVQI